ncbi:MAG: hypothetical protein LBR26_06020 [Prevotella sp.]|jgi:hypothetical protein|nr:hypothetical protein [Prevotella sp.]
MNKVGLIRMAVFQTLHSSLPFVVMIGIAGLCFFSLLDHMPDVGSWPQTTSVAIMLDLLIGLAAFKKFLIIFAAIPCAAGFCTDWNSRYIRFVIIRSDSRKYIWTKLVACAVVTFLVVFIGMSIFVIAAGVKIPLFFEDMTETHLPFASFATGIFPFAYVLAMITVFALFCSFNTTLGLMVSAFIPNRYVAVIAPMICAYFLEELTARFPAWLSFYALSHAVDVIGQGGGISLLYYISFYCVMVFMVGLVFSRQVKRRIRDEVV